MKTIWNTEKIKLNNKRKEKQAENTVQNGAPG